jgi:lipoprotein signal peptidase
MRRNLKNLLIILLTVVTIDQAAKHWSAANLLRVADSIDTTIYQGQRLQVFEIGREQAISGSGDLSAWIYVGLNYVRNHGASWGLLRSLPDSIRLTIFHTMTIVCVGIFLLLVFRSGSGFGILAKIGVSAMISGAAANMLDRVIYGYVIDFIDIRWRFGEWSYNFPPFNIADMAIVTGLLLFTITSLRR